MYFCIKLLFLEKVFAFSNSSKKKNYSNSQIHTKTIRQKKLNSEEILAHHNLEPFVEACFFFNRTRTVDSEQIYYWTEAERADSMQFRGAFLDYFAEMQNRARTSLLPKYVMLFSIQVRMAVDSFFCFLSSRTGVVYGKNSLNFPLRKFSNRHKHKNSLELRHKFAPPLLLEI